MDQKNELKIEYLPIDALKPYKRNARKHGKIDVDNIALSIKRYGMNDPIGIWSDERYIVEGEGRWRGCKLLKMERVPCIRLDHLTDKQRREYAIAHNVKNTMAYYDGSAIAVNETYFSPKMTSAYDQCVASGFHPPRGKKTAMQAVAAHEIGHGLTDKAAAKMGLTGMTGLDAAATRIVTEARKLTGHQGVVQMASKISKYATQSNAEAVAEAFSDVFCNGKKARAESRAIVDTLEKYLK